MPSSLALWVGVAFGRAKYKQVGGIVRVLRMSNQEDQHRPGRWPSRRDEQLREQIVETYARICKLNALAVEVLRRIVAESAVRGDLGGKIGLRLPSRVTLEQQTRIARPLWKLLRRRREQAVLQLEGIPGAGRAMARIVRHALANPMVVLSGKSPLDGYLRVCREIAMHWGIVRVARHLRDARCRDP